MTFTAVVPPSRCSVSDIACPGRHSKKGNYSWCMCQHGIDDRGWCQCTSRHCPSHVHFFCWNWNLLNSLNLQHWTAIRSWIFIGLIQLTRQSGLFQSQNFLESFTLSIDGRTQLNVQANEPLVVQIQAWFFKLVKRLTCSALLCFSCFMQTNLSLESTGPTTQYTVSALNSYKTSKNF